MTTPPSRAARATVAASSDLPPTPSGRRGFGRARRLGGQRRVPPPPARITPYLSRASYPLESDSGGEQSPKRRTPRRGERRGVCHARRRALRSEVAGHRLEADAERQRLLDTVLARIEVAVVVEQVEV